MSCKSKHFCTCRDTGCVHNPNNPEGAFKSCDSCIGKNLERGEIPSCFFRRVKDDLSEVQEFTFEGFVKFYLDNKK